MNRSGDKKKIEEKERGRGERLGDCRGKEQARKMKVRECGGDTPTCTHILEACHSLSPHPHQKRPKRVRFVLSQKEEYITHQME
jgi:hypothetical protein